MSFSDYDKKIIITDCLTGKVIISIPFSMISTTTLNSILEDVTEDYLESGYMVKLGY